MWGVINSAGASNFGVEPRALCLAICLAVLGFAARYAVDPLLGDGDTYVVFYPLVAIAGLFLGPVPAGLVTGLLAISGYAWFDHRHAAGSLNSEDWTPLLLFLVSSVVMTALLAKVRSAMSLHADARRQAEALAADHAVLFGEMNARVANHLQLIAGLLQLHARDEQSPTGRAFEEASAHTLLISKLHREIAGDGRPLDFGPLARRLVDAAAVGPRLKVEISRGELWLRPDQATSAAVVLLERLRAHQAVVDDARLTINLRAEDRQARIELICRGGKRAIGRTLPPLHFIEAMVEQLGGRFQQRETECSSIDTLAFPLDPPARDHSPSPVTLH